MYTSGAHRTTKPQNTDTVNKHTHHTKRQAHNKKKQQTKTNPNTQNKDTNKYNRFIFTQLEIPQNNKRHKAQNTKQGQPQTDHIKQQQQAHHKTNNMESTQSNATYIYS